MRIVCQNHIVWGTTVRPNIKATRVSRWLRKAERNTKRGMIAEQLEALLPSAAEIKAEQDALEPPMDFPDYADDYNDDYDCWPTYAPATPEELAKMNSVEVVNICAILDRLFGADRWELRRDVSYGVQRAALHAWMEENDACYYGHERHGFSLHEAQLIAVRAGKSKVVAEDLS